MRRQLAAGLVLSFALAVPFGGACSSFGEEEPSGGSSEAGANEDGSTPDASSGEASTDTGNDPCRRCEAQCLPSGCAPFEPVTDLPPDLPVTGLVASGSFVFLSVDQGSAATLYRIPISKKNETAPAKVMTTAVSISDIALSTADVLGAMQSSGSGTRTISQIDKSANAGAATYSAHDAERVAVNDTYVYGALDASVKACALTAITSSCSTSSSGATVSAERIAAQGSSYCISGKVGLGQKGIYCGVGNTFPPAFGTSVTEVTALTMRGGKVFWATADRIGVATYSTTFKPVDIDVPNVVALDVDGDNLFYSNGVTIVRCDKDTCPIDKRTILTAVPGIQRLVVADEYVYFVYGPAPNRRLGRVPWKP